RALAGGGHAGGAAAVPGRRCLAGEGDLPGAAAGCAATGAVALGRLKTRVSETGAEVHVPQKPGQSALSSKLLRFRGRSSSARPGPARPDAAPQLALDGLAEAVAAEVVALERRTDLLDPGSFQSGDDQRAVGGAASRGVENRGQSARPARHP